MPGPLRHSGSWPGRGRRGARSERDDGQALAELEARPLELPAGLEVEWLGVSGYRLSYEGQTLFIDPYLSRVPFRDLLLRRPTLPDPAALDRFVRAPGEVVGVLVGHTHFDHAVDAPAIARRFGCKAYGSSSLVNLMGLHGLAERAVEVEPYRTYELGPVRGQLHAQRPLEAAARPRRPLRRRTHLRAPRRALPRRLPLRPGLGDLDRGRRAALLPPGQRQPDRRRDPRARRRRLPRRRRRPQLHRATTGSGSCPASSRASSSRPTTTTSSARSARPMEFVANVQLAELPEEIGAVSADIELAALPRVRPLTAGQQCLAAICSIVPIVRIVVRAERGLERLQVELGVEHAAARQPVELAALDREPVLVGRQRQRLAPRLRAGGFAAAARPGACPRGLDAAPARTARGRRSPRPRRALRRKTGTS